MEIRLIKSGISPIQVDKRFSVYYKIEGELKDSEDISNPSVIIDISSTSNIKDANNNDAHTGFNTDMFNINYAYISSFNRYYFVRKITVLRKNIIQYDLHVDVLQFVDFIKNQKVYVSRNQNDYDIKLPDERRILKNTKQTYIFEPTTVSTGSLVNTTFNPNPNELTDYNIVVSCIKESDSYQEYWDVSRGQMVRNLPNTSNIGNSQLQSITRNHYVIDSYQLAGLLVELKNNSNLASFIGGIYAYPFEPDYRTNPNGSPRLYNFIVGDTRIKQWDNTSQQPIDADVCRGYRMSKELIIAHFKLTTSTYAPDFNFLEPYSLYEIYLPFYGWKEIKVSSMLDHELLVYYTVNYNDGSATVFLYDNTLQHIIFSAPCMLGVEVPLSTTNAKEVKDRRTTNAISTVLQLVGSGLAITGGAITGNPLAVAGGVLAGTKAIGSSIANEVTNYERGQIQFGDNINALLSEYKVYIRRTKTDVQYSADSNFLQRNGGICNKLDFLNNFLGYTEVAEIPYYAYSGTYITSNSPLPTKTEEEEITTLLKKGVIFIQV